jgi:hypothetical protein
MKKITVTLLTILITCLSNFDSNAQNSPVWTQTINSSVDTATIAPVRTRNDANNNVYVLSFYYKSSGPVYKIHLNKYSMAGTLLWNLIYDNGGIGLPRGFDLAVDNTGNCYIAGGFMATSNQKPLLLKVSTTGSVIWMRDSTNSFNTSFYSQVILKNNLLYLSSSSGIAAFDINGAEVWSHTMFPQRIAVDNNGQMIVSGSSPGSDNLFRYDVLGNLNFSDSSIYAARMTCDFDNSFYLLTDYSNQGYELVKYDSSGIFQWSTNTLPVAPPFGDIGFDVLTDYNNDVILVGLNDTMFKFSSSGNLIWSKSMNGLDNYRLSAEVIFSNMIAVAGTVSWLSSYDIGVALFDINGNMNWQGLYDGTSVGQEFTVDMTIDNSGIYVVEDLNDSAALLKFASPFSAPIDYSLICVDSVWYDTLNPTFINVRIFNGNPSHLNYPSVQIVSPVNNDTIGNPSNFVNFFAQLGNTYQIYSDTITQQGITDFTPFTFLISEGFGATTALIYWCGPVGIPELEENEFLVFPNPAETQLTISNGQSPIQSIEVFDISGRKQHTTTLPGGTNVSSMDVSELSVGIYFLRIKTEKGIAATKFVKQ